jgi:hypothetical protein
MVVTMVAPHPPSTTEIPAAGEALLPVSLDAIRFDGPCCRNCGAVLVQAYCGRCGQKQAIRLGVRDLGRETWERWRLFEFDSLRTAARLLYAPGRIAREYVLGMRKRNFHPLKLLLVAVALLALALARANYLQSHRFGEVNQAMALVANYANWSFSLGILAILIASLLVFPRRLGYRPVEHLVLAAYCQALILLLILLNLLPTLFGASAEFVQAHKSASSHYLFAVKAIVVAVAFKQFHVVDLRRHWWQWLAAIAVYLAANWALSRLYARLVLWYVVPVPA